MTDDQLADAVRGYARRLHAAVGATHHVASPLGAWIVLALAASAAREPEAEPLAEVLGMPLPDASRLATALLDEPHPAVAAAAAAWTAATPAGAAARWVDGLPAAVGRGPIPNQARADAWAHEHTFGMIDRFPIDVNGGWGCVLASALATDIKWTHPFVLVDGSTQLRTPPHGHDCSIARHPGAGDVAVHRAHADGLTVTSVIAAPDIPAGLVLDAAHDADHLSPYALSDLPLGDGHAWTVTESTGPEQVAAVLPAWTARSSHDLTPPELGFADAARALGRFFGNTPWGARQAAYARYHQYGFKAAAVTALVVAVSAYVGRRSALLRFDRPFAVVATASTDHPSPWNGLPVFSAWVTRFDQSPAGSRSQP